MADLSNINTIRISIEWGDLHEKSVIVDKNDTLQFDKKIAIDTMIPLAKSFQNSENAFSPVMMNLVGIRIAQMYGMLLKNENIKPEQPKIITPDFH
jgi:hypothetical protein